MSDSPNPVYRVVKHVTRPLLKMEMGKEYFVEFESAIYQADPVVATRTRASKDDTGTTSTRKMDPPQLADVKDLAHGGRPSQIIVNAVLGAELLKKYPKDAYIGKAFRLVKNQLQGKSYATFEIAEIELNTPASDQPAKRK